MSVINNKKFREISNGVYACLMFLCGVGLALLPQATNAATLNFSPIAGTYTVGKTFAVSVYVASSDLAMNAASGVVSFPVDKLEITSLSRNGSILNFWVQEPSFSNSAGNANFEGVVFSPGYTGASGKIITINFKTKAAGTASIVFLSGSVLANDGKGTNILTNLGSAKLNIEIPVIGPAAPSSIMPGGAIGAPAAPVISSPTNSDPEQWYATRESKFTWDLPKDVTAVRTYIGKIPQAVPMDETVPITSKDVSGLADGIWYFGIRLKNNNGWGGIAHFRFQIDNKKPDTFIIKEEERGDLTEPRVKFYMESNDETSGVDHYEIKIDGREPIVWFDDGSRVYETSPMGPGRHIFLAKVFDKAGNFTVNSYNFIVEGLRPPIITEYPSEIERGDIFIAKGYTNYVNSTVIVWLQHESEPPQSRAINIGQDGKFTFISESKLAEGIYKLWTEVEDARNATSGPSEKIIFTVAETRIIRIGSWAINALALLVILAALLFSLAIILWYSWKKFSSLRSNMKKEATATELRLRKAFKLLKEEIPAYLKTLKKDKNAPELGEEEKEVAEHLTNDLTDTEKFIEEELDKIKKETDG